MFSASAPRYIYSVDGELWNAQSNIPSPYYSGDSTLTQIKTDYSQIEAIGFNFNKDLIYFSDTQKDNIYRGIVAKKDFIEHTVNEYNVQGEWNIIPRNISPSICSTMSTLLKTSYQHVIQYVWFG